MDLTPEILIGVVSTGSSIVGAAFGAYTALRSKLGVLETGQHQLAATQQELRGELREAIEAINGRCDRHAQHLAEHGERIKGVERDVVHFGDRIRILRGEANGLRGATEGQKP